MGSKVSPDSLRMPHKVVGSEEQKGVYQQSTTTKILRVAGVIFGIGLLVLAPFAISFGVGATAGLAALGAVVLIASLRFSPFRPQVAKKTSVPQELQEPKKVSNPEKPNREGPSSVSPNGHAKVKQPKSAAKQATAPKVAPQAATRSGTPKAAPQAATRSGTPKAAPQAATRSAPPLTDLNALWEHLSLETRKRFETLREESHPIVYYSTKDLHHRFQDIGCIEPAVGAYFPSETPTPAKEPTPSTASSRFRSCFRPTMERRLLHANKVGQGLTTRTFVASQAPLEADHETFWKAIYTKQWPIFDLTTMRDRRNGDVQPYYPENVGETCRYGRMTVTLDEKKPEGPFVECTYSVKDTTGNFAPKEIKRVQYLNWPDHGVVSLNELKGLVDKAEVILDHDAADHHAVEAFLWVHCRAGVGRTGSLITALILKEMASNKEITPDNLEQVLIETIVRLREQRGPLFVQRPIQLGLLREYVRDLLGMS